MLRIFLLSLLLSTFALASNISLKKDTWNFVGFKNNITISQDTLLTDASKVNILWTYTNDNTGKRWNAYSPDATAAAKIKQFNYNTINRIENYQGVWVYPKIDFDYPQSTETFATPSVPGDEFFAGWNLLSSPTGEIINASSLSNAGRVYVYRSGVWYAHHNDGSALPTGVEALTTIGATEAYWAYYGNSSSTNTGSSIPEIPTSTLSGKISTQSFLSRILAKVTTSDESPNEDRLWITPDSVASSIFLPPAVPGSKSIAVKPPKITQEVEIESDGSYLVPDLPSGPYSLVLANNNDAVGQGVKIDKIIVPPGKNIVQNINSSQLASYGAIKLKIQSLLSGSNISGVNVRINQLNLIDHSDSNGIAEFAKVPQGNYSITISKSGYVSKTQSFYINLNSQNDLHVIKLSSQKGSISGVVTAEGLNDYSNILVYAKSIDGSTYSTLTNSLGYYTFASIPVGDGYSIMASANAFQVAKSENISVKNGKTTTAGSIKLVRYQVDVDENIIKVGSITGYARYIDVNDSLEHAGIIVSIKDTDYEAVTSRDGSYILNNIPEGNYTLNFTDSNHKTQTSETLEVIVGAEHSLDDIALLPKTGNVIGLVHDESGTPVANVFVVVNTVSQTLTTYTDSNGNFTLNGVLAGEYEVQAAKDGYGAGSVYTMVTENQTIDTSATPIVVTRKLLTGTINLQNTTDHSGAIVSLVGSDVPLATTDSNGDFTLYGVSAGNYQLQISKAGYLTENITLAIASDNGYSIAYTINIDQSLGEIKGFLDLSGYPNSTGVEVRLVGTEYKTYTDASGAWVLEAPIGNYDNGIEYSKKYFESFVDSSTITVTETGSYKVEDQVINQNQTSVSGKVSIDGISDFSNTIIKLSSSNGTNIQINPDKLGSFSIDELLLGTYQLNISYPDGLHESVTKTITLNNTTTSFNLGSILLREVYVNINQGDAYTNSKNISLEIGHTGANFIQIVEGSTSYEKEPFITAKNITLSANNGEKTVTVNFFDGDSHLPAVSDTIFLDDTLVASSFTLEGASTKGDTLHIKLNLNEPDASVYSSVQGLFADLRLVDNGQFGDTEANDGIYERTYTITTPLELDVNATAIVIDRAGNEATFTSTGISLKTQPSIENVSVVADALNKQMTVSFTTDEPTTSSISHGDSFATLANKTEVKNTLSTNHSIVLSNLTLNQDIFYELVVNDASDLQSLYKNKSRLAPVQPENLSIVAGNAEIGLLWDKVTQNAAGYNVYKSLDGNTYTRVNSSLVTYNYYLEESLQNEQRYYYYVTALDAQGNESLASSLVSATPSSSISGPTIQVNSLIDSNHIGLKSKSPYIIDKNIKLKAGVEYILMPGTKVEFQNSAQMLVEGVIKGYATQDNKLVFENGSLVFDTEEASVLNYVDFNSMKVYKNIENAWDRRNYVANLTLNKAIINANNGCNPDFYIKSIKDSVYNERGEGCNNDNDQAKISNVTNTTFNKGDILDYSLNAPVTSSSGWNASDLTDDDYNTELYLDSPSETNLQSFTIDLGASKLINTVAYTFYSYSQNFKVYVSLDQQEWTEVVLASLSYTQTDKVNQSFSFPEVQARYIKTEYSLFEDSQGNSRYVGVFDISVYNSNTATFEGKSTTNYVAHINSAINSIFANASFRVDSMVGSSFTDTTNLRASSISNSTITNARIEPSHSNMQVEGSTLNNVEFPLYSSATFKNNTITKTNINISSDNNKLTMHYNTLDIESTVSADILDISHNYWGENNLTSIANRTGYSSNKEEQTHLYPIITSADLYNVDVDGDSIEDYRDHDNDNDGYSDLQEDWASDPAYGSIYNPLDPNSYPINSSGEALPKDNDMDTLSDDDDADDDNDGISDVDEANYGTSPYLSDSDGDGVNDNNEISYKYDPVNKNNYPIVGNKSGITIDSSNVNTDGVVYIVGGEDVSSTTLTNITILPGTKLTIEKDTQVTIQDSTISGTKTSPIIWRSSGAGTGGLYLSNTDMSYANVKLALKMSVYTNSTVSFSDLEFKNSWNQLVSSDSIVKDSFINGTGYWYNYGAIKNSYITGNYFYNSSSNAIIDSSYVKLSQDPIYNHNGATIKNSYIEYLYAEDNTKVENSVINRLNGSSTHANIINSDVKLQGSYNHFYDGTYISNTGMDGSENFYDGLGAPVDQIGDGVAETVFTIDGTTYTVDGIVNPRSSRNFEAEILPYKTSSIWDPTNVGCWWDKDNPDTFPDKNPLTNSAILKGQVTLPDTNDHSGVVVSIPNTSMSAITDTNGNWSMTLSARVYSSVSYTKEYFETQTKNIYEELNAGETKALATVNMVQKYGVFSGSVLVDDASDFTQTIITANKNGVETIFHPEADGTYVSPLLTLGDYTLSISYPNGSWETVTLEESIVSGTTQYTLATAHLRNSFVYINDNARYTNTTAVNLSLTNANASTMQITYGATTLNEEAYASSKSITLDSGDGEKTVSVVFKDTTGGVLTPASSNIVLDTTVNLSSFTATGASTMGDTLQLTLNTGETGGVAKVSVSNLFTDLELKDNGDGTYSSEYLVDSSDEFNVVATASFIDRANNTATTNSSQAVVLATTPTISNLHTVSSATGVTITFDTNELVTSTVNYGTIQGNLNNTATVSSTEKDTHSITISVNSGETLYYEIVVDDTSTTNVTQDSSTSLSSSAPSAINGSEGDSEVGLIWSKVANATAYDVYRSVDSNTFTKITTTPVEDIYYLDATVENDTIYQYRVTAIVNGVESDQTTSIYVRPSLDLAGPTEIDGAVILADTIWLSSRSPYKLLNNVLIKEERNLILLAGTKVEMLGEGRHIMNKGYLYGYGSSDSKIVIDGGEIIFDTANESELNFAELNYVKIYKKDSIGTLTSLTLNDSIVNINNNYCGCCCSDDGKRADFYINKINDSTFNQYGSAYQDYHDANYAPKFGTATSSIFKKVDSIGEWDITNNYIVYISSSATNSVFEGGSVRGSTFNDSNFTNVYKVHASTHDNSIADSTNFEGISSLENSKLDNGYISGSNMKLNYNTFTNVDVKISNTTRLAMRYNILDSSSSIVNSSGDINKYLNISHNYWGSADMDAIALQTNYSPSKDDNSHLYPVITSPLLYEADYDGDTIPDYRDHDNDNDGYSDLQEDWDSDPAYGSIYSPLDDTSFPGSDTGTQVAIDTDMDSTPDTDDLDDDNDGVSDENEANYGTSPYLSDSDGDGVNDNAEISYKYNPINKNNYPIVGNKSGITIDSANVNTDGVVYIVGEGTSTTTYSTLTNVTILPGTKITIEKDTQVTIQDSSLSGTKTSPIIFRSSGAGTGRLYLSNTDMSYANVKLALSMDLQNNSKISFSDLEFNNGNFQNGTTVSDSFIHGKTHYTYFNGYIKNSFIIADYSYMSDSSIIESSYISAQSGFHGRQAIIKNSYVEYISLYDNFKLENSVVDRVGGNSDHAYITNSDIKMYSGTKNFFFDGVFITNFLDTTMNQTTYSFYDGLGAPVDQIGDGVAETVFTIDGSTYTVDGIVNPRSTKNYPDWTSDPSVTQYFWNSTNVGCLWDMNNPDVFPEPQ